MIKLSILLLSLIIFNGCSSDDEVGIKKVDTKELVKDSELLKSEKKQEDGVYYIGFDLRGEPQEDLAQYIPLLNYLQKTTNIKFKLHITPKESSTEQELCLNKAQFSILGALSFLKAHVDCDAKVLVRGLNNEKLSTYKSIFITKIDSKINSINDLKGASLAFGSVNSTQGHLIPRIVLKDNNISLKDLDKYTYTGSHQKCAEAVLSGDYDVCSMQDTLAKELAKKNLVKIIYRSGEYPSSLIAINKNVPPNVIKKIKQALLNFDPIGKDKKGLYHWENTEMPLGFIDGNLSDYDKLHSIASELGIIKACKEDLK